MIADMADAIALLGTGTYTVKRRGPTTYTNGRRVPQTPTNLSVTGTLVPLTPLEVKRLPDGLRDSETWNLFTPSALVSSQDGAEPDSVVIDGKDYAVERVTRWDAAGGFFVALLVRPSS